MKASKTFKIALCQYKVFRDKAANISRAKLFMEDAAKNGADIIVLPEFFNCPINANPLHPYAEPIDDFQNNKDAVSARFLSDFAKEHKRYVIGGSMPEATGGDKIFNTCLCFDREGNLKAKYRKLHLFDIDIKGGIKFKESAKVSPGDSFGVFETEYGNIGIGICYDMRFPEMALTYVKNYGAKMLCYPACFNTTTGPLHWDIIRKARAIDSMSYVFMCSQARVPEEPDLYQAYGSTSVTSPWGRVVGDSHETEIIVYQEVNLEEVDKMREQIPVWSQKRWDMYDIVEGKKK